MFQMKDYQSTKQEIAKLPASVMILVSTDGHSFNGYSHFFIRKEELNDPAWADVLDVASHWLPANEIPWNKGVMIVPNWDEMSEFHTFLVRTEKGYSEMQVGDMYPEMFGNTNIDGDAIFGPTIYEWSNLPKV